MFRDGRRGSCFSKTVWLLGDSHPHVLVPRNPEHPRVGCPPAVVSWSERLETGLGFHLRTVLRPTAPRAFSSSSVLRGHGGVGGARGSLSRAVTRDSVHWLSASHAPGLGARGRVSQSGSVPTELTVLWARAGEAQDTVILMPRAEHGRGRGGR